MSAADRTIARYTPGVDDVFDEVGEGTAERRAELLDRVGTSPGLCADCIHLRLLKSPHSVFVRCGLADTDPRFSRYPRLPVRACQGFSSLPDC